MNEPQNDIHLNTKQQSETLEEPQQPTEPRRKRTLSRRQFLILAGVAGAAGTSLLIGYNLSQGKKPALLAPARAFSPNVWVQINPDNTVVIQIAKAEMGQGVLTTLAMLVAEELDAEWSLVRAELAPADEQFGNQLTDGSSSISQSFSTLRSAGAQARALLVEAAAQAWGVDTATCRTERGAVIHIPSGRRYRYGELTGAAAALKSGTPLSTDLKNPKQFRLIGTPVAGIDTPARVDGSARFGLDVRLQSMLYAVVARCPYLGGTLGSFDSSSASAVPGVRQVLHIDNGVAVVAENTWAAIQGRKALQITWNGGQNASLDSAQIRRQLASAVQALDSEAGNAPGVGGGKTVEAVYELPYLAHATMEPMNCTAFVQARRCEVWVGTQDPQQAQFIASQVSGLPQSATTVHPMLMGGGFGRRAQTDFVAEAVQISKAISTPVQVVWTRDDDLQHDWYRPASYHHLRANMDAAGLLTAWTHTFATQSDGGSPPSEGAEPPYSISPTHINGKVVSTAVQTGIWRAVNYSYNTFVVESFLDEIAAAGGNDPYQLRLKLAEGDPRLQAVLTLAATKAGWETPLPAGWGRGIAACNFRISNTYVAEVAEVSLDADGSVRVHRVVCAVDCGLVVNPTLAQAQVEGAVIFGLTAALKGEITVAEGQIQQRNFSEYPLLRINESPSIEVYFVPSQDAPTGLGEPALPPIAPAVANALFAATGKRIRRLPIQSSGPA